MSKFTISVKTSDRADAGTDASVYIILIDSTGSKSDQKSLYGFFTDNFERDQVDTFEVETGPMDVITDIEIWRNSFGFAASWHLEYVKVVNKDTGSTGVFPFHRWLNANVHYMIELYDCSLPQDCKYKEQRAAEMKIRADTYRYKEVFPKAPYQVFELPSDDAFSASYQWNLTSSKLTMDAEKFWVLSVRDDKDGFFKNFDEMMALYDRFYQFPKPRNVDDWKSDIFFGDRRKNNCNPKLLTLCTAIPEKFALDKDTVKPLLEGLSVDEAIAAKRLFIIDLTATAKVQFKEDIVMPSPYCLLFVNKDKKLVPVAIQLFKDPGEKNPVFYPSDDPSVWLQAKIWYCLADCGYHTSISHLGATHLVMESLIVALKKTLSLSHPIYKLLAPHFYYLLAINASALKKLLAVDGVIDKNMAIGRTGCYELLGNRLDKLNITGDADFLADIKRRGVDDPNTLPDFNYRDDGKLLYDIVRKYADKMVKLFYKTEQDIVNDTEIQAWGQQLATPKPDGIGCTGIPGDGKFSTHDHVTAMVTFVIFSCSVEHAAVNFSQFDDYGFPPAYPAKLRGHPLQEKTPQSEEELMKIFCHKENMVETMITSKILSERGSRPLGDFEVTYLYKPEAVKIVEEFRADLKVARDIIVKRDETRMYKYLILDPAEIPNSICI